MMDYWRYPGFTWPYPPYHHLYGNAPWTYPLLQHSLPEHETATAPMRFFYSPGYQPSLLPWYPTWRPPLPEPEPELNPLLGGRRRPTIIWNAAKPPHSAQRIRSDGAVVPITAPKLGEPATRPPVQRMRIVSNDFSWDIITEVPPPGIQAGEVVTMGVVLDCIYMLLHEPLDAQEWESKDNVTQRKIQKATLKRLANAPPSLMPGGRALKIDCLLDRTVFMGLKPAGPSREDWLLSLGSPRY